MVNCKIIGGKMRKLRENAGEYQRQVAERLNMSLKHYGRLERGDKEISISLLAEFGEIYGADLTGFFKNQCINNKKETIDKITDVLQECSQEILDAVLTIVKNSKNK